MPMLLFCVFYNLHVFEF
uniref:Uncharacterized protein n=1 Tax=Anguilla anguilla TaxID=7936 RepID=A0A0E9UR90_ANGAN